jgi:phage/plasmid-associated DNA primase
VLEVVYKYCIENGYIKNENAVLCADGLMIEKALYKPELLVELEEEVKRQLDYALKFTNKKMELGYNKVLDKHLKFDIDVYSTKEIANIFKVLYMDKFLYINDKLYSYDGVYWKANNDKRFTAVHHQVTGEFLRYMERIAFEAIRKHMEAPKDDKEYEMKMKRLNDFMGAIVTSLRDNKKRKNLVDDIIYAITCDYVEMDANPDLLCFTNGVYDLQTGTWTKPHYKQYVSMTTGWAFNQNKADRTLMNRLLEQIFPKKKVRDMALIILSTALWGKSIEKFVVFTGRGGNGKGLLDELLLHCLGDYGYTMSQRTLLEDIKTGANPEVANLHKKRFGVASEPDAKDEIKCSTMKTLTSNGSINCRGLYSSVTNTIISLLLVMEANDLPKFDEVNDAVKRRLIVVLFESMFVSNDLWNQYTDGMTEAEIKAANIFKADLHYKSDEFKVENRQAFIEILFEYFQKFREAKYQLPNDVEECKQAQSDYLDMSDDFNGWFRNTCEEDKDSYILVKDLYNKFITTEYYLNMTKKEKRTNNQMKFKEKIKTNLFIGKYYRDADKYFNKIQIFQPFVAGFRIKQRQVQRQREESEFDETDNDSMSTN